MPGNAAIYSSQPPPDAAAFPAKALRIVRSPAGEPTQYAFQLGSVAITINVMSAPEVPRHLAGFRNYVLQLERHAPRPETSDVLEHLSSVRTILGVIAEPGFDEAAEEFVWGTALAVGGMVFAIDSVFSAAGDPLLGPAAAPAPN